MDPLKQLAGRSRPLGHRPVRVQYASDVAFDQGKVDHLGLAS
jgi:hypothetical protein